MKPLSSTDNDTVPRKPAPQRPDRSASASRPASIEVFEYPAHGSADPAADWSVFGSEAGEPEADAVSHAEFEERLAEETRTAFEQGRERGRQEGQQGEREAQREAVAASLKTAQEGQVRQLANLAASFAAARDRYLGQVEHEVVKLALAIAARILRREAQMDPLLLTGAARVALGQLASTTEVKLRVPPGDAKLWAEAMALLPNLPLRPTVIAVDGLRLGDCLIETSLGTVDLGIRAQLAEIERGFFDRAGAAAPQETLEAVERIANRVEDRAAGQPERRP